VVVGLNRFREEFKDFEKNFVIIGGTACSLLFEDAGQDFRSTKDIDLVIIVETLNSKFVERFWHFIKEGGYTCEKADGTKTLYRFAKPTNPSFPKQIELFARIDEKIFEIGEVRIIPIVLDDYKVLSAILLDEDYYLLIKSGIIVIGDLPILKPLHIIPLKAKAYLNNKQRKSAGELIQTENITKHCRDVFRLVGLLSKDNILELPRNITINMQEFISVVLLHPEDLGTFLSRDQIEDRVDVLKRVYSIKILS